MKKIIATLLFTLAATAPAFAQGKGVYMGRASTGEPVYYHGARAQCGDLPRTHECWKNPMLVYTIGSDEVTAIPDCRRGVFKEVWVDGQLVERNLRPQSEAIRLVLRTACNSVR